MKTRQKDIHFFFYFSAKIGHRTINSVVLHLLPIDANISVVFHAYLKMFCTHYFIKLAVMIMVW